MISRGNKPWRARTTRPVLHFLKLLGFSREEEAVCVRVHLKELAPHPIVGHDKSDIARQVGRLGTQGGVEVAILSQKRPGERGPSPLGNLILFI